MSWVEALQLMMALVLHGRYQSEYIIKHYMVHVKFNELVGFINTYSDRFEFNETGNQVIVYISVSKTTVVR